MWEFLYNLCLFIEGLAFELAQPQRRVPLNLLYPSRLYRDLYMISV